jgi:hypothetical protein
MRELSMDPYYYQLHISIDNSDTGHARIAIDTGTIDLCVRVVCVVCVLRVSCVCVCVGCWVS